MPGINVVDRDGDLQEFPDASTWHVDERGQLHLNSDDKPVATFARDCWQGVAVSDDTRDDLTAEVERLRGEAELLKQIRDLSARDRRAARKGAGVLS